MTDEMQKARRKLEVIIADSAPYDPLLHDHEVEALDALIAAVRAETLREVRGEIVAMRKEAHSAAESWDTTLGSVISRLDALAHPEGTE